MLKKEALYLLAALSILPAAAGAQSLDWTRDPVSQFKGELKAAALQGAVQVPVVHPVSVRVKPDSFKLYATAVDGQWVGIPTCDVNPAGGRVSLSLAKTGVGAVFTSPDGQIVHYVFQNLTVSQGKILYGSKAVGTVSGSPEQPGLFSGYSLNFRYGGIIDSCTDADMAAVDVFIQGPRP